MSFATDRISAHRYQIKKNNTTVCSVSDSQCFSTTVCAVLLPVSLNHGRAIKCQFRHSKKIISISFFFFLLCFFDLDEISGLLQ